MIINYELYSYSFILQHTFITNRMKRRNPFDIRQENTSKHLQKLMTPPTNKFAVKNSIFINDDHLKSVKPIFNVFSSRLNNPLICEPGTTISSEANLTARDPEPTASSVTSGLLSQRIEANLKSMSDFYSRSNVNNLSETVDSCREKDYTVSEGSGWTVPGENSVASNGSKYNQHCIRKTTLDKYFRAAKISRRSGNFNAEKPIKVETKNDPTKKSVVGEQRINALRIDGIVQPLHARLQPKQQLRTSLGIDTLFSQHFSNSKF